MKWRGARRSQHVEDRRFRTRHVAAGGGGLLAVLVVAVGLMFPGAIPILEALGIDGGPPPQQQSTRNAVATDDEVNGFVSATLGYTEDVWGEIFAEGGFPRAGRRYNPPRLVLFSGSTESRCGPANASVGPFYCPADQSIYIDPQFYNTMATRLGAPGDFAQAYVIAHEVAHHVQFLNGRLREVLSQRRSLSERQGNQMTVRLELQADCFAGVWARRIQAQRQVLEEGDLDEAVRAAHQVGDDVLSRMSGAEVNPSQYTHGSGQQRMSWFRRGYQSGQIAACDTFNMPYEQL